MNKIKMSNKTNFMASNIIKCEFIAKVTENLFGHIFFPFFLFLFFFLLGRRGEMETGLLCVKEEAVGRCQSMSNSLQTIISCTNRLARNLGTKRKMI